MAKTFTLRIDLESDKGIKAVPKLLDLLKKYQIKVSFYIVMGGESNIFELLKNRGKMTHSEERKIKIWSFKEKVRMALFPKDFIKVNVKILNKILEEGHELGIHGWKHRAWTRSLKKIDIQEHISKSKKKYEKFFGKTPISFAAPGFNTNSQVLKILEEKRFKFVSDFQSNKVKTVGKMKNVPITILGKNRMPFIEYFVGEKKSDKEISEMLLEEIKNKNLSSFYIHGLFEARFKLNILETVFKFVKKNKIKNKRIIDY